MSTNQQSTPGTSSQTNATQTTYLEVNQQPVCLIVLGMAGSGKTTFVKKLFQFSGVHNQKQYTVNLDPACKEIPYHAHIGKLYALFTNQNSINP